MSRQPIVRTLAVLLVTAAGALVGVAPSQAATNTIVSLTFDDGQSSQYSTLPTLASHGMAGTFYINSGDVGSGGYYMTWSQIQDLANAGNEIGGHTVHHTDLTAVSTAEATAAVCDDRTNLQNRGYNPTSFAYPYAAVNATAESIVKSCGYSSGRDVGGTQYKETIPPADAYRLRTPPPSDANNSLQGLENAVTGAESSGGGWVIIVFHGVCDNGCTGTNSTTTSTFNGFLDWLQARAANGTVVRTVGDVMGGSAPPPPPANTAPTTVIACNGSPCTTTAYTGSVSVTLAATDPNGDATTTYYTTDGSDPTTSSTRKAYTGAFSVTQSSTVRYYSTDSTGLSETPKSQLITVTSTAAAPTTTIRCNGTACATGWYRSSPVTVTLSASDPNGDATTTYYTTDGSDPTTSSTRTTYNGAFPVAQTSTVRFYSTDSTGLREAAKSQEIRIDDAAPNVTMTAPTSGSSFSRRTRITLSASAVDRATGNSSASGIAQVVFFDGTTRLGSVAAPTSGTSTYSFSWNARKASLGSHSLTAVATDVAGNATTSTAVQITLRR